MKYLHPIRIFAAAVCVFSCSAFAQGVKIPAEAVKQYGLKLENIEFKVKGLKKTYHFVHITDLHVMPDDMSEVRKDRQKIFEHRRDIRFANPKTKLKPSILWKKLPELLNPSGADAIFFGADICDFGSIKTYDTLIPVFKQFKIPFIFLRTSHDISTWILTVRNQKEVNERSKLIDGHPDLPVIEYDDLLIIGWDNNEYNIKKGTLEKFKKYYAKGKPILFVIHVPITIPGDGSQESMNKIGIKHVWNNKNIRPNQYTKELFELVTRKGSPVIGIVGGHVHRTWDGLVNGQIRQHIFSPAFEGNIGIITVKPE